jgi:predicted DNA-binding transcriptional regulator YafY
MQSTVSIPNDLGGDATQFESHAPHLQLPLARLLQLVMILQSQPFPNARQLAELCGVSRRTIYRDLSILETAGFSVVYRSDRQGYQLERECLLQPPQLDEREALALLLESEFGGIPEPFGSLLPARLALTKVFHSLPAGLRDRLAGGAELIAESSPAASALPEERREVHLAILNALLHRQRIRLWYREVADSPLSTTDFGLYKLARVQGQWALIGHSSSHDDVWLYWLPWVEQALATGEPYAIPPRFRLDRFLAKLRPEHDDRLTKVQLRFSANMSAIIRDMPEVIGQSKQPGPNGTLDVILEVETLDEVLSWVLSFGDDVEVIGPAEFRKSLCEWAERIVRRHADAST